MLAYEDNKYQPIDKQKLVALFLLFSRLRLVGIKESGLQSVYEIIRHYRLAVTPSK